MKSHRYLGQFAKKSLSWLFVTPFFLALHLSAGHSSGAELVRNGDFAQIMADWGIPDALRPWYPYQHPSGRVALHPDVFSYSGPILEQTLHVSGVASQTVQVSIDLGADWALPAGQSFSVALEYIDNVGARQRVTVIAPDNALIPVGSMAPFSASYSFPANASKLVSLLIVKSAYGQAYGDNVSLTHPSLVAAPVPALLSVDPPTAVYGQWVTLHGRNFGATQGTVTTGGSTEGIGIVSWTDDAVVISLNDPCAGGSVMVEAAGCRTTQDRSVGIATPHFRVRANQGPFIATPTQTVRVPVFVDFRSGFSNTDGPVTLSAPTPPAPVVFSPPTVADHGGSFAIIDTSSLTPGIHTFTVRGDAPGTLLPRFSTFEIDVRTVSAITATYLSGSNSVPLSGATLTAQGAVFITPAIRDQNNADIGFSVPTPVWTSSNPTVVDLFVEPPPFGGVQLLVKGNGTATITATMPNGAHWDFPVTVALPASPLVMSHAFLYNFVDNTGAPEDSFYFLSSHNITYFSWGVSTLGITFGDGSFGDGGLSYSGKFTVETGANPGKYLFNANADTALGSISSRIVLNVVNAPSKGLLTGEIAVSESVGSMHGEASGELEFYDATTGTLVFSKSIWSMASTYTAPYLTPGSYKLRWISSGPTSSGLTQWLPNSKSFANAQPVVVAAGGSLPNIDFFLNPEVAIPQPPALTQAPVMNAGTQTFSLAANLENGVTYLLQKSFSLSEDSWFTIATFYGSGASQVLEDAQATEPSAFYRIVRL